MLYVLGVWLTIFDCRLEPKIHKYHFCNPKTIYGHLRIKDANDYSLDQMCAVVSVDILNRLGMGVIGKDTIKGFYRGENIKSENLEKIGAWIDHYHIYHWVTGKELPVYELGLGRLIKQACSFMPFLPWNNPLLYYFLLSFLLSQPAYFSCITYEKI